MNNLSPVSLRQRLEALPARREAATQGDLYARFQKKAAEARVAANQAGTAADLAGQVLDDDAYKDVRSRLRGLARTATKVRTELAADASAVTAERINSTFAGLSESATAALNDCKKAWKRGIDAKLKGRAELAAKLPQILPALGNELGINVSDLQTESQRLPRTAADVQRVRELLAQFDELVRRLQLEGAVGKFLQEVASGKGASLDQLRDKSVQQFLTDYSLWTSFRVGLP